MRKLMAGKVQGKAYLGSVNQKVAPCPSSESTPRVPPWASMIFLQITSPSPLDFSPPVGFEVWFIVQNPVLVAEVVAKGAVVGGRLAVQFGPG